MIQVTCSQCQHSVKAPDEFAGRKVKCRKCGHAMRIAPSGPSPLPVVRNFRVEKTLMGKYVAAYRCPHCNGPLRSEKLEIRNGEEACPECGMTFRVTTKAIAEIESRRKKDEDERQASKQARDDAKQRKAEEKAETQKQKSEARELERIEANKNVRLPPARSSERAVLPRQRATIVPRVQDTALLGSKPCPFCGESIMASAVKCRYCGEMLYDQRMQQSPSAGAVTQVIVNNVNRRQRKSAGLAFVLALLFGPLGMVYSTVAGALALILVNIVFFIPTFGFILLLTWPIGCIWAAMAANDD